VFSLTLAILRGERVINKKMLLLLILGLNSASTGSLPEQQLVIKPIPF